MKRVAVIFPGIGYHCDKPLLYFSRDIACECGYTEYINLRFRFAGGNIRGDKQKMKETFKTLYAQAEESLCDINWNDYDDILFISKSIGTVIATQYAHAHHVKNVRHILYTPLEASFLSDIENGIAFIGTSDPWSRLEDILSLAKERNVPIEIYEECNHSLETSDTLHNIDILDDIMQKTGEFIKSGEFLCEY